MTVDAHRLGLSVRDIPVGVDVVLGEPDVDPAQRLRLAELGIRPGVHIQVVQRSVGGARIVAVYGSRIALDARTAARLPTLP